MNSPSDRDAGVLALVNCIIILPHELAHYCYLSTFADDVDFICYPEPKVEGTFPKTVPEYKIKITSIAPLITIIPILSIEIITGIGSNLTLYLARYIHQVPLLRISSYLPPVLASVLVAIIPLRWTILSANDCQSFLRSKDVRDKGRFEEWEDLNFKSRFLSILLALPIGSLYVFIFLNA